MRHNSKSIVSILEDSDAIEDEHSRGDFQKGRALLLSEG